MVYIDSANIATITTHTITTTMNNGTGMTGLYTVCYGKNTQVSFNFISSNLFKSNENLDTINHQNS